MWLCLLMCMVAEPNWSIPETGVFQPLDRDEVIVAETGEVYVLNFGEATISRFDKSGALTATIGGKGKGPGELMYPMSFFLSDNKLYVMDVMSATVNVFAAAGEFEKRIPMPRRGLRLARVADGWIYGDWAAGDDPEGGDGAGVFWADNEFKEEVKLMDLENRGSVAGLAIVDDGSGMKARYQPISTEPRLAVSKDGNTAYLGHPDGLKISVIDVAKRRVVHTFRRNEKPLPFDNNWGDTKLAEMKDMMKRRGHNVPVQSHFPKNFPIMRDLFVDAMGRLVIDRWVGDPDNNHHFMVCNPMQDYTESLPDWKTADRIVGARDNWVYVTVLDPKSDEAGIVRCKADKAAAFIAANPIEFDGSVGRTIAVER